MNEERITERERKIAVKVMMQSRSSKHWAEGQLKFFGLSMDTPEGQTFYDRARKVYAERIVRP